MVRFLSVLTVSVSLLGCADQTAIVLEVTSSDLDVPADIDQLHFVATGASGVMADRTTDLPGGWPQTFALRPGNAAADEAVDLQVEGLLAGRRRLRRVLPTTRFVRGRTVTLSVELERACLDVDCPAGVDCRAGMCVGAQLDAGMDGGADGGIDGGLDAGTDAAVDGGFDAGTDAAVDGGSDGGSDVGTDAETDSGVDDAGFDAGPPGNLILSEYVEGTANNKALELAARGGVVDLSACELRRFTNGAATASAVIALGPSSLAAGSTFVVCHSSAAPEILARCDLMTASVNHNGDDAYELVCDGTVVDSFGRVGEDPGAAWTAGGVTTRDATLRRKCAVTSGDADASDPFDPSVQWDAFPTDEFTGLGAHCS